MMKATLAAFAITFALTAGAFAAEDTNGSHGDKANRLFGMDASKAGTTDETRKAFWDSMKPEDQAMVMDKCKTTDRMSWSPQETDFCRMVQK
jgi:hypothetical protein